MAYIGYTSGETLEILGRTQILQKAIPKYAKNRIFRSFMRGGSENLAGNYAITCKLTLGVSYPMSVGSVIRS